MPLRRQRIARRQTRQGTLCAGHRLYVHERLFVQSRMRHEALFLTVTLAGTFLARRKATHASLLMPHAVDAYFANKSSRTPTASSTVTKTLCGTTMPTSGSLTLKREMAWMRP